jgi:hypothetical protein
MSKNKTAPKTGARSNAQVDGTIEGVMEDLEGLRNRGKGQTKAQLRPGWLTGVPLELSPVPDKQPAPYRCLTMGQITPRGELARRIDLNIEHVLKHRKGVLSYIGWGAGEPALLLWSGAPFARSHPKMRKLLQDAVQVLRDNPNPDPDGQSLFFEDFDKTTIDGHDWEGNSGSLLGLMAWYRYTGDDSVTDLMAELVNHFDKKFPMEKIGPKTICAEDNVVHIKTFAELYRLTGNRRFLQRAQRWTGLLKPLEPRKTKGMRWVRIHQHITATTGLVDLYEITGQDRYLLQALRLHKVLLENWMWVTGGISEGNTCSDEHNDEYCGVSEWIRLNLVLAQVTGEARYLDIAEHIWRNHHGFDQDIGGGFVSCRSFVSKLENKGVVCWFCCSMKGTKAMADVCQHIFTTHDKGIRWNLLCDSSAKMTIGSREVRLVQKTGSNPAAQGTLKINVSAPTRFTLEVRIPAWASSAKIQVNGKAIKASSSSGYVPVTRRWAKGDTVSLQFGCSLRVIPSDETPFSRPVGASIDPKSLQYAAIMYGPYVLMIDRWANEDLIWDDLVVQLPVDWEKPVKPARTNRTLAGAFAIPAARIEVTAANKAGYYPPGWDGEKKPGSKAKGSRRLVLRPVSEITNHPVKRHGLYQIRNHWMPWIPES